jgi:thiamine-monophosphate kinase
VSADEFERIERFFAPLAGPEAAGLADDVALLAPPAGRELVIKTDTIVEGVHYLPDDPPDLVARKLLRVNLSDLAAKGAEPLGYVLDLTLPDRCGDDWLEAFCRGLAEDQRAFGFSLFGGDSARTTGPAVLSATLLGGVASGGIPRRGGARLGDYLCVTGTLGDAALGLAVLRGELPGLDAADRTYLADRYRLPQPRLGEGRRLAPLVHAMMDVSDGLVQDAGHICKASSLAAVIELEALPLSPAARRAVKAEPDRIQLALGGGDDYELLCTAATLPEGVTVIGRCVAGSGVTVVDRAGKEVLVASPGYRHF